LYGSHIFYTDTKAKCDPSDPTQVVCAITNDYENITSPWYYDGKFDQGYAIPARNFFEGAASHPIVGNMTLRRQRLGLTFSCVGGIVVNGLVALANMTRMPCYSSFLATTRVSNKLSAISEDFAFGGMKKCGLAIDADCLGGHQLVLDLNATYTIPPFEWNYTVSVTNLYAPPPNQLKVTRHVVY